MYTLDTTSSVWCTISHYTNWCKFTSNHNCTVSTVPVSVWSVSYHIYRIHFLLYLYMRKTSKCSLQLNTRWAVGAPTVPTTVYNVRRMVYSVRCTMYSVQCTVYNVQCTMYGVQCTMGTWQQQNLKFWIGSDWINVSLTPRVQRVYGDMIQIILFSYWCQHNWKPSGTNYK